MTLVKCSILLADKNKSSDWRKKSVGDSIIGVFIPDYKKSLSPISIFAGNFLLNILRSSSTF